MLLPYGNPFKCHEEVLYLQPIMMIPPKRFDIFFPLTGVGVFRFFFKNKACTVPVHNKDKANKK